MYASPFYIIWQNTFHVKTLSMVTIYKAHNKIMLVSPVIVVGIKDVVGDLTGDVNGSDVCSAVVIAVESSSA